LHKKKSTLLKTQNPGPVLLLKSLTKNILALNDDKVVELNSDNIVSNLSEKTTPKAR
jgi:hypothetical protein